MAFTDRLAIMLRNIDDCLAIGCTTNWEGAGMTLFVGPPSTGCRSPKAKFEGRRTVLAAKRWFGDAESMIKMLVRRPTALLWGGPTNSCSRSKAGSYTPLQFPFRKNLPKFLNLPHGASQSFVCMPRQYLPLTDGRGPFHPAGRPSWAGPLDFGGFCRHFVTSRGRARRLPHAADRAAARDHPHDHLAPHCAQGLSAI